MGSRKILSRSVLPNTQRLFSQPTLCRNAWVLGTCLTCPSSGLENILPRHPLPQVQAVTQVPTRPKEACRPPDFDLDTVHLNRISPPSPHPHQAATVERVEWTPEGPESQRLLSESPTAKKSRYHTFKRNTHYLSSTRQSPYLSPRLLGVRGCR